MILGVEKSHMKLIMKTCLKNANKAMLCQLFISL